MKPVRLAGGERGKQRPCAIRTLREAASSSAGNRVPAGKRNTCWPGKCSSNTQPHQTRWPALQEAGIDGLFSAAVLSYPLGVRKPSPAFCRIVLAAADCPAGQVLFVGDHLENDAAAPARHEMRTALVRPRGLRPGEVLPDGAPLITHLSDLPPLFQAA
jgi:FMN phosphatase YigB (HAD superfamily)